MTRYEEIVVGKIVAARKEMLEAIDANDVHQYDGDIRTLRGRIDELLDLLVEFADVPKSLTVSSDGAVKVVPLPYVTHPTTQPIDATPVVTWGPNKVTCTAGDGE